MPTVSLRALETLYAVRLPPCESSISSGHVPDLYLSTVMMAYYDKIVRLPEGFVTIASTEKAEFAAIAHKSKPIFGSSLLLLLALYEYRHRC